MQLNIEQDASESNHLTGYSSGSSLCSFIAENPAFCICATQLCERERHFHDEDLESKNDLINTLKQRHPNPVPQHCNPARFSTWELTFHEERNVIPVGQKTRLGVEPCSGATVAEYLILQASHKLDFCKCFSLNKIRKWNDYELVKIDASMLICSQWIRCGAISLAHDAAVCV